jgi:cytochrome c oxidase subunit 2
VEAPLDSRIVLSVFLVGAVLAITLLVWLANYRQSVPLAQSAVTARGYGIRRYWFWFTLIVAFAVYAITIPAFPYRKALASVHAQHYSVIAQQYGFTLPAVVPLDTPVVFDVTAKDVNHGFGIYNPSGRVISQVQAMPLYVNHLAVTFAVAGHYTVRCLEFCGIAHAAMQGGFDVK